MIRSVVHKTPVTIWNEFIRVRQELAVASLCLGGVHQTMAYILGKQQDLTVRTATMDQVEQGLPPAVLDGTDVLSWWGHGAHDVAGRMASRRK
jgi:trehalose utilization protein